MSSQMYPMASSEASLSFSTACSPVTWLTNPSMTSGHWFTGSSAHAMAATHCTRGRGRGRGEVGEGQGRGRRKGRGGARDEGKRCDEQ